jgi:hypothetical protein
MNVEFTHALAEAAGNRMTDEQRKGNFNQHLELTSGARGAEPGDVARQVLRETLVLALLGIPIAIPIALVSPYLVRGMFYGLSVADPLTLLCTVLLLVFVAVAAGLLPARRRSIPSWRCAASKRKPVRRSGPCFSSPIFNYLAKATIHLRCICSSPRVHCRSAAVRAKCGMSFGNFYCGGQRKSSAELAVGDPMSNVIVIPGTESLRLPPIDPRKKRNAQGLSTSDFRRLLTQLKHQPPSQRAFLRKLLRRAIATGAPTNFPVVHHVVRTP